MRVARFVYLSDGSPPPSALGAEGQPAVIDCALLYRPFPRPPSSAASGGGARRVCCAIRLSIRRGGAVHPSPRDRPPAWPCFPTMPARPTIGTRAFTRAPARRRGCSWVSIRQTAIRARIVSGPVERDRRRPTPTVVPGRLSRCRTSPTGEPLPNLETGRGGRSLITTAWWSP